MPPHKPHGLVKEGRTRGRLAKACAQCRAGKTRCDFAPDAERCNRCVSRGIVCIPYGSTAALSTSPGDVDVSLAARRKSNASKAKPLRELRRLSNDFPVSNAPEAKIGSGPARNSFVDSPGSSESGISPYKSADTPTSSQSESSTKFSTQLSEPRTGHDGPYGSPSFLSGVPYDYGASDRDELLKMGEAEKSWIKHRLPSSGTRPHATNLNTLISAATSDARVPGFDERPDPPRSNPDTSKASSNLFSTPSLRDESIPLQIYDNNDIEVDEDDMNADMALQMEFQPRESSASADSGLLFSSQTENFLRAQGVHGLVSEPFSGTDQTSLAPGVSSSGSGSGGSGSNSSSGSSSGSGSSGDRGPLFSTHSGPVGLSFPFGNTLPAASAAPSIINDASNTIAGFNFNSQSPMITGVNASLSSARGSADPVHNASHNTTATPSFASLDIPGLQSRLQAPLHGHLYNDTDPYTLDANTRKADSYPYFQDMDIASSSSETSSIVDLRSWIKGENPAVPNFSKELNEKTSLTRPEYYNRLGPLTAARSLPGFKPNFQDSVTHMALCAIDPGLQSKMGSASLLMANPQKPLSARNVITAKVMSKAEVVKLIDLFKGNYDHWIGLPEGDTSEVIDTLLEKCPLLVTTCCSIALRFGSVRLWQTMYPVLVRYLSSELAQTLVESPQNTECVQAFTILAKYADSLSFGDQVFDMWSISGTGIQQLEKIANSEAEFSYTHMRLWNHLVLAHLSSANTTGRQVVVSSQGMELCKKVLNEPTPTRFDKCMVAEIMIQWQTNRYLSYQIRFSEFERQVELWREKWGSLASLPMIQFIEPVLLFCSFLTRWTHVRRCWYAKRLRAGKTDGKRSSASNDSDFEDYLGDRPMDTSHALSPISPMSLSEDNGASMEDMYTSELLAELSSFNAIIMSLLQLVEPKYFVCLSDSIHQIGFLSGVMTVVISKIVLRREPYAREIAKPLEVCDQLVRQLAVRFRATSRGYDVAHTQCAALCTLLSTVNLSALTPPSTAATDTN